MPIMVYHDVQLTHTSQIPCALQGRKDKDARKGWTSTLPKFYARNRGSMKDACGCLVLESFNTTRGVRVGRQHRSKSKRQYMGKRHREEKRKAEEEGKG